MNGIIFLFGFVSIFILSYQLYRYFSEDVEKKEFSISLLTIFHPVIAKVVYLIKPLPINSYREKIKSSLKYSGLNLGFTSDEFIAVQVLCSVICTLLFYFVILKGLFLNLTVLCVSFLLPKFWINDYEKKRNTEIFKSLPTFLDFLTLAVEAGLDFNIALLRVLKIYKKDSLSSEFGLLSKEMKLGLSKEEALRNVLSRNNSDDLKYFITALIQAEKLGVSLGPTLRIQSGEMRLRRMSKAEKAAAKAPTKMLIPMMIFIFPAIFIMIFGPIIIQFKFGF